MRKLPRLDIHGSTQQRTPRAIEVSPVFLFFFAFQKVDMGGKKTSLDDIEARDEEDEKKKKRVVAVPPRWIGRRALVMHGGVRRSPRQANAQRQHLQPRCKQESIQLVRTRTGTVFHLNFTATAQQYRKSGKKRVSSNVRHQRRAIPGSR